ncbi:MAG: deoxyribodipyrimidine photo-lyase, partial [Devosiaceae bacterium]|nr:deoxyribodipyrimidine photo-lyase [Devosiaceae bacterium MH13]
RWWLHHSLISLRKALEGLGVPLILRRGDARTMVPQLAEQLGAQRVVWNRRYSGGGIAQDTAIKADLKAAGFEVTSHNGHLLYEPWTVKTGSGGNFRVFTPFSRAARATGAPARPQSAPDAMVGVSNPPPSDDLAAWALTPDAPDWSGGLADRWTPGPAGATARLERFVADALAGYPDKRNNPGIEATSLLSPHLRFGEISPRTLWHAAEVSQAPRDAVFKFHQELLWREFSYQLLYTSPDLHRDNHQPKFDRFPWADTAAEPAKSHLRAWQKGLTGYPIVDAGMRELWHTGWMHNRVRMVVGSFLVKHLLLDWRLGEDWFWDTLVDADPANNAASWQWVAGSGADAAPYFRVFNPVLQGEKFDGDGAYTRKWVPELSKLPKKFLHKPWEAPAKVLAEAGVALGESYPRPIVDHAWARQRALDAFKSLSDAADAA